MAIKTKAQLVDRTSIILEDAGEEWYMGESIASQLQACLPEVSDADPWTWDHIMMAVNSSKLSIQQTNQGGNWGREIDLSLINWIDIDEVEHPVGFYPRKLVYPIEIKGNKLFLRIATRPLAAEQYNDDGVKQVLTGTVTFTSASTAVSGSGTAFTSELEIGTYISPSGSGNWYRVASITNDTALVLATNCASGDAGADTAGSTRYWYEYVILTCTKVHYLEDTLTDLTGAINAGVPGGYADGTRLINVDGLDTSGTMPKDRMFTIAGVEGIYRVKADATLSTGAANLWIEPALKGIAPEDAVVTFLPSSLTPHLEEALCTIAAGRVAMNFITDARTAQDNAVAAYALGNAAVDSMTVRLAQIVTDAGTARTAASANFTNVTNAIAKAETSLNTDAEAALDKMSDDIESALGADGATLLTILGEVNTEIDQAVTDVDSNRTDLTGNDTALNTALAAITDELTQAIADADSIREYADKVPTGLNPVGAYGSAASGQLGIVMGKVREIDALIKEGAAYQPITSSVLLTARGFLGEVQARMAVEAQLTTESLREVRERIRLAYGSLAEAREYSRADAQKVNNLYRVIVSEMQSSNGYLNQSGGYFRESQASLNASRVITDNAMKWGTAKIAEGKRMLRRIAPSVVVTKSHA